MDWVARPETEPGDVGIDDLGRFLKLAGPNDTKCAAALGAERVLTALPTGRTTDDGAHPEAEAHEGEHGVLLIIGMGARVKHGHCRFQP